MLNFGGVFKFEKKVVCNVEFGISEPKKSFFSSPDVGFVHPERGFAPQKLPRYRAALVSLYWMPLWVLCTLTLVLVVLENERKTTSINILDIDEFVPVAPKPIKVLQFVNLNLLKPSLGGQ